MVGSINGLTGGFATGTTFTVVQTNDPDGYNMTIRFPFSTTTGMDGDATASFINNYSTASSAGGVADYGFDVPTTGNAAEFGYTVNASTTADLDPTFRNNGTVCGNTGGGDVSYQCWINGSTTAETIINTTSAAPYGATTTLRFKVAVPNNPSPSLSADTYTATATLTATNNP